ncbi:hypothetical protein GCM10028827_02820 [Mucilaginibacter myungsuensis]
MTGLRSSRTEATGNAQIFNYFPLDSHPPAANAVAKTKQPTFSTSSGEARSPKKAKYRSKFALPGFRCNDVAPFYITLNFGDAICRISSLVRQHHRTVLVGALPHYYAYLFRLTPF